MPRRKRLRKVVAPPKFQGYKPYGINGESKESVELLYEEYEAIKLADYDFLNHSEAAKLMGISRPTFARIYESARRKIAKALTEAKEIVTVFGDIELDGSWFLCKDCHAKFTCPTPTEGIGCPMCKSQDVQLIGGS